jgi:hypothetical protein
VASAGLDAWSADGTSIVAVRIGGGTRPSRCTTWSRRSHPATPSRACFYDFDEIAALLLRPI